MSLEQTLFRKVEKDVTGAASDGGRVVRALLTWLAVLILVLVVSPIFAQMAGPWPIVAGATVIGGAIFLVAGAVSIGVAITSIQLESRRLRREISDLNFEIAVGEAAEQAKKNAVPI